MDQAASGENLMTELLVCPKCQQELTDPRSLTCQHACCTNCLESMVNTNDEGKTEIVCPVCASHTRVPPNGVSELPESSKLLLLKEFRQILLRVEAVGSIPGTDVTNSLMGSVNGLTSPALQPVTGDPIKVYCEKHKQLLTIYCGTCEGDICTDCLHGQHKEHQWHPAGDFTSKVHQHLSMAYEKLQTLKTLPHKCTQRQEEVSELRGIVKEKIETAFTKLHEELDTRKASQLNMADKLTEQQLRQFKVQTERAQNLHKLLTAYYETINDNMVEEVNTKPVFIYRLCADKLEEILGTLKQQDMDIPLELKVNIDFWQALTTFNHEVFQKYAGQVILRPSAQARDVRVEGRGAEKAVAGLVTQFKVLVVPLEGKPLPMFTDNVVCTMEPETAGEGDTVIGTCQIDEADGTVCKVTYVPAQDGPHLLKVSITGAPVPGSPFSVTVGPSLIKMEQQSELLKQGKKQMKSIAVGRTGETMLLVKSKNCQIKIYTPGKKSKTIGKRGSGTGQFITPSHVAFTPDFSHFFVTDTGNHRVQKFSLLGKFVAAVGSRGKKELEFDTPTAIAVDSKENVYVVEVCNDRIQVLTPELLFHHFIPCPEGGSPTSADVDSEDNLYISYRELHCIHKIHPDGHTLLTFGETELTRPSCLCVSRLDLIFVGDEESHSILAFSSSGELLHRLGRRGTRTPVIQLDRPGGISIDDNNHLYICDTGNGRLLKL